MASSVAIALEKLEKGIMLQEEDREALRELRRNEPGTEPPCPWCHRPRVLRSDYIRCNPCGTNWLVSEMHLMYDGRPYLSVDPRLARAESVRMENSMRRTAGTSTAEPSAK